MMANTTKRDQRRAELIARLRSTPDAPVVITRLVCGTCGDPAKYELNLGTVGSVALYCPRCLPKNALLK